MHRRSAVRQLEDLSLVAEPTYATGGLCMVDVLQPLARCFFAKQLSTGRPSAFRLAKIEVQAVRLANVVGLCLAVAAD